MLACADVAYLCLPLYVPFLAERPIPVELNTVMHGESCDISSATGGETDSSLLCGISLEDLQDTGLEATDDWSDEAVWERMASDMELDSHDTSHTAGVTCEWPGPVVTSTQKARKNGSSIVSGNPTVQGLGGGSATPDGGSGPDVVCDSMDSEKSYTTAPSSAVSWSHGPGSGMTYDCGCGTPPSDHEDLLFNEAYDAYVSGFDNSYTVYSTRILRGRGPGAELRAQKKKIRGACLWHVDSHVACAWGSKIALA